MTRDTDERGKLLPCPFCNRQLEHDDGIEATRHPKIPYEEYCPLRSFLFASDRTDIIKVWNTRAPAGHAEREGFVLVPVIPTPEMIEVGCENNPTMWNDGTDDDFAATVANDVYVSMVRTAALSNAPAPSEGAREEEFLKIAEPLFEAITRLNRCLADLGWKPSRTHIEGARNTMQQVTLAIGRFAAIHSSTAPADTEDQGPDTLGERP